MNSCDILIFRKKTITQTLYSIFALDLDNHVGIVFKINNKLYLYHFVITDIKNLLYNIFFRTNYKCGEGKLTPIEFIDKYEYYHYKPEIEINLSTKSIEEVILNTRDLNYQSNILILMNFILKRNIFCTELNNDHTCISFILQVLHNLDFYNLQYYTDDYYKKDLILIQGIKFKYKLISSNNSCKKDLSYINPYAWSYIISLLHSIYIAFSINILNLEEKRIFNYKIFFTVLIYTIFSINAGSYSTRLIKDKKGYNGMRFIGAYVVIIGLSILSERYLNISSNNLLNFIFYLTTPRVFLTRFASWLCNDLTGKINEINLRPYDTAFYESLFEGLIPFLLLIIFNNLLSCKTLNIMVCILYSTSRFIIEFYKNSYLGNKTDELNTDVLTCGQIDSILYFIFTFWYIFKERNFITNIYEFLILFVLFMDVNYRITRNKMDNDNKYLFIKLKWQKTFNRGFYGGRMKNKSKQIKLFYGLASLLISNLISLNNLPYLFTFNVAALINIGERYIYGFVTDYLTINFMGYKTYNLNFSDIIISTNIIYSITLRAIDLFYIL